MMLPAELRAHLYSAVVGQRLFFHPQTDSTNDLAVAGARSGEPEGSVFYTDFQRRGRGRQGQTNRSDYGFCTCRGVGSNRVTCPAGCVYLCLAYDR